MKCKKFNILMIAGICFSFLSVFGCSSSRISLVDQGGITVEKRPSNRVKFLWTDVYHKGNNVIIHVALQRRSYTSYLLKTHVDVKVVATDGKVIQETCTPDFFVPLRRPGKGINWKSFDIHLDNTTKKFKVALGIHEGSHEI